MNLKSIFTYFPKNINICPIFLTGLFPSPFLCCCGTFGLRNITELTQRVKCPTRKFGISLNEHLFVSFGLLFLKFFFFFLNCRLGIILFYRSLRSWTPTVYKSSVLDGKGFLALSSFFSLFLIFLL